MAARYPHDAALTLRRSERMRAEGELASAQRALDRARQAHEQAAAALREQLAANGAGDQREQSGQRSSAVEVQRAAAFSQRQALAARQLRAAAERAQQQLHEAEAALQLAQQRLAVAHGREQAV